MANHMTTYVKVDNLNEESFDKLIQLIYPSKGQYNIQSVEIVNRLFETDYSVEEKRFPDNGWMLDNIGAKWIEIECDDTPEFDTTYSFRVTSAWHVPEEYLLTLTQTLVDIKSDVVLYGTYEDESYDPIGAFVYADDYDDAEDLDIEIDFDQIWEDADYRISIFDELHLLKENLYDSYLEYIADKLNDEK
jgi:hypothetical protein